MGLFVRAGGLLGEMVGNRAKPSCTIPAGGMLASVMLGGAIIGCAMVGCANPGPPKPPSLYLPATATKVSAERVGDAVEVRFTAPLKATDGVPLKAATLPGSLCRQMEQGKCLPIPELPARMNLPAKAPDGAANTAVWRDELPQELGTGSPRAIGYRLTFYNGAGKAGAQSDVVYASAGAPPAAVTGLRVQGARAGVVISWNPESPTHQSQTANGHADILLRREEIAPKETKKKGANAQEPGVVWLKADGPDTSQTNHMLDDGAEPDVAYRYSAVRRWTEQVGGRILEMRSTISAPVTFTWSEIYPPAAPTGLNAAGFATEAGGFAVDLIWQPVNDEKLAGYNIYRETVGERGGRVKLNDAVVPLPAFHDATAKASVQYRYSVTAVDAKGNESTAVTVVWGQ